MQREVWSVEGRTRSGQVFLRTIGHLCLGNFRRRLARVYVNRDITVIIGDLTINVDSTKM